MGALLAQVTTGKIVIPDRITLHGLDGVGKSTFGSQAPNPIFLGPERGTASLNVARLPATKNLQQIHEAIRELTMDQHDYKTLVIDSWDWIEPLIWAYVCTEQGCGNIEEVGGGFAKGYVVAMKYWRALLHDLDVLQTRKGMGIIGICHSDLKTINSPLTANAFDRYVIKLHNKAASLLREWSEVVLFANKEIVTKGRIGQKGKAMSDGTTFMYSKWTPSYDAKTRYAIPEKMPLSYAEYYKAVNCTDAERAKILIGDINELIAVCTDEELKKSATEFLPKAGNDVLLLTKVNDRLRERMIGKEETANATN